MWTARLLLVRKLLLHGMSASCVSPELSYFLKIHTLSLGRIKVLLILLKLSTFYWVWYLHCYLGNGKTSKCGVFLQYAISLAVAAVLINGQLQWQRALLNYKPFLYIYLYSHKCYIKSILFFVGEVYSSCVLFLLEACLYITEESFSIRTVRLSLGNILCACDLWSYDVWPWRKTDKFLQ